MKRLLFSLFVFLPFYCFAQYSNIEGFWGLRFGMTREDVLETLVDKVPKNQINFNKESEVYKYNEVIELIEVEFGGKIFDSCTIFFSQGELYCGLFKKNISKLNAAVDFQLAWEHVLSLKYGKSEKVNLMYCWMDILNSTTIMLSPGINSEEDIQVSLIYLDKSRDRGTKKIEHPDI